MKLYIDTSHSEKIHIEVGGKTYEASATIQKAQVLLPLIVESLEKEGIAIKDISEIEVNKGPGSFTGLRVGFSVANALGFALKIPVNNRAVLSNEVPDINYSS